MELLLQAFPSATSDKSWCKRTDKSFFDHHVVNVGTTDVKEDLFMELTGEGFDLLKGIKINYEILSGFKGFTRGKQLQVGFHSLKLNNCILVQLNKGIIICCRAAKTAESDE